MSDKQQLENKLIKFMSGIRHCHVLGMRLVEASKSGLIMELPYSEAIVGNPETGVIHGGAITTLMDQTSGMSVVCALYPEFPITPTIDLRIDYMGPAKPGHSVFGFAEAYRITEQVVFTRGIAYQEDRSKPIANCVGTFTRISLPKQEQSRKAES